MSHVPSPQHRYRGSPLPDGTGRPVRTSRLAALFVVLVLALAMALAACGTGETTRPAPQGTTTAGSTASPTASPTGSSASMPAGTAATASSQAATTGALINMKIDAKQAREMLNANKNAILLDVRTVEENRERRIPGSTLIPITELSGRLNELPKDPNRPILIYCRSGNRSAQAAAILKQAGFPAVYDFGGIIDWPYETEQG